MMMVRRYDKKHWGQKGYWIFPPIVVAEFDTLFEAEEHCNRMNEAVEFGEYRVRRKWLHGDIIYGVYLPGMMPQVFGINTGFEVVMVAAPRACNPGR